MLGKIAILILLFLIIVKILKYYSGVSLYETRELMKAIRMMGENLTYSQKKANVIALLARVEISKNEVKILISTKGFWEVSTDSDVRQIFRKRVESQKFKDFLDLTFDFDFSFSEPEVKKDEIIIRGSRI